MAAEQKTLEQIDPGNDPVDADLILVGQNVNTTPTTNTVTFLQNYNYVSSKLAENFLPLTGGTLTGPLFIPTPSVESGDTPEDTQVVPYITVQVQASYQGTKQFVFCCTAEVPHAITYYNGPNDDGQGATITADNPGLFVADGVTPSYDPPFNRVLIKNQFNALENGIYDLTYAGSDTTPFILTRSPDFDNSPDGQIGPGVLVYIYSGDTLSRNLAVLVSQTPVLIGVNEIIFDIDDGGEEDIQNGIETLVNGTVTIDYVEVTSISNILVNYKNIIGTPGFLTWSVIPAESFTITSTSNSDNSVISYAVLTQNNFPHANVQGTLQLSGGNGSVPTISVTDTCVIMLQIVNPVNSMGRAVVNTATIDSGFTVTSNYGADDSECFWKIYDTGSPQPFGMATLASGTVTVSLTSVTADSVILLTIQEEFSGSPTNGYLWYTINPGVGFTINSSYGSDTSVVGWVAYNIPPIPSSITLVGELTTVEDSSCQENSLVFVSIQNPVNSFGNLAISSVSNLSFNILSSSAIDNSLVTFVVVSGF